ncbi:MAG: hypothetical protein D6726_03625 [Nitrospirae bacterium]|nr:MAG: hypothetical protein D6726_03625 [Nitrospirota bacterium]
MEIEVTAGGEALDLTIENPFKLDAKETGRMIKEFAAGKGVESNGLDVEGLLPKMVRGVYGCEEGCPADAKQLVTEGYSGFAIEYIEGGILKAEADTRGGKLVIKVFPEF